MLLYENALDQDSGWALSEGSRFFEGNSAVQSALRKITRRLEELGIDYAVVGGMALFSHGFRRFTEDVDVLVKPGDLKEIHRQLEGRGYLPPFPGSKNLRDTETGVRIEFLVAGQYPGDGKPKPVAFPAPEAVSLERDGIRYLTLPSLIELKLASGMSSAERLKDLADVQELIKLFDLPENFTDSLNDYVREKYRELWQQAQRPEKRYLLRLGSEGEARELLERMGTEAVRLEPKASSPVEGVYLSTTDPEIATRYDMHDEAEFL